MSHVQTAPAKEHYANHQNAGLMEAEVHLCETTPWTLGGVGSVATGAPQRGKRLACALAERGIFEPSLSKTPSHSECG